MVKKNLISGIIRTYGKVSTDWVPVFEYDRIILGYLRRRTGPVFKPTCFSIRRSPINTIPVTGGGYYVALMPSSVRMLSKSKKMEKIFFLRLLIVVSISNSVHSQSYAAINDTTFNTVYFVNNQLITGPFLIDPDSIRKFRVVKDTLIMTNNKVFKNCIFLSYLSQLNLIPLKKVKKDIQEEYSDFSHIYMINNEFIQKSASDFLIDENYVWKTELLPLVSSNKKHPSDKILIIRIFTKSVKDELENKFHIR